MTKTSFKKKMCVCVYFSSDCSSKQTLLKRIGILDLLIISTKMQITFHKYDCCRYKKNIPNLSYAQTFDSQESSSGL